MMRGMTKNLKDIVFETDRYWVKRVPKGFEVYKTGLTHSTRVAVIGYTGDKGLQRAKLEIERRENAGGPSERHHATKKSPAQLQREINEALASKLLHEDRTRNRLGKLLAVVARSEPSGFPSARTADLETLLGAGYITYGLHPMGGHRARITRSGLDALA
jgi:hypothetical protein